MHTVTVTHTGDGVRVLLGPLPGELIAQGEEGDEEEAHGGGEGTTEPDEGPSPIAPEAKELLWGLGAFVVFLVLMRLFLFPRLKQGMDARYGKIQSDLEQADATRAAAQRDVAEYQAQLDAVKVEAVGRVEAARQQLESERQQRLAEVNERIAARRSAAAADRDTAREAARGNVEAAVADVAKMTVQLSTGRSPDDTALREAVSRVTSVGVGS